MSRHNTAKQEGNRSGASCAKLNPGRQAGKAVVLKDSIISASSTRFKSDSDVCRSRLVAECMQVIDEYCFSNASAGRGTPHITFELHDDRLVVMSKQNPFSNHKVLTTFGVKIAETAFFRHPKTSDVKFQADANVSDQLSIQSGAFSFTFTRQEDKYRLRVTSSVNNDPKISLLDTHTQISLLLRKGSNLVTWSSSIREQFESLGEGILFTRNLKQVGFKIYSSNGELSSTTCYSTRFDSQMITKTLTRDKMPSETQYFHLTKHTISNSTQGKSNSKLDCQDEIILAFPLPHSSTPVFSNLWAYPFQPLYQSGFNFIVRANFVTTDDGQRIDASAIRNLRLAQGIADAFIIAILDMCKHSTLQYTWMNYLPSLQDPSQHNGYWSNVVTMIADRLQITPVLQPASFGPLVTIRSLKRHPSMALDQDGLPLFADIVPELYVAPGYMEGDLDKLEEHGLSCLSIDDILARVEADLQSPLSRIKSKAVDDEWHSRVAILLKLAFDRPWFRAIEKLRTLDLIPLRDGRWVSANSGPVYYAETKGLEIPPDVGIDVVDSTASENPKRRRLFDMLGVQTAPVALIREKIRERYAPAPPKTLTPDVSLSDLQFLYATHHLVPGGKFKDTKVLVLTDKGKLENPSMKEVYIAGDIPLNTPTLLAPTPQGADCDDGAPGFDTIFLHKVYFSNTPSKPQGALLTWESWLYQVRGINQHLRLISSKKNSFSGACKYVAQHRPRKFLSLLNSIWDSQGSQITKRRRLYDELRSCRVLCKNGRPFQLKDTYLPTAYLKSIATKFLGDSDVFPWLELETPLSHPSHPPEWKKITSDLEFGFAKTDLDFALSIMKSLIIFNKSPTDESLQKRVYDLYCFIEVKICESANIPAARQMVRDFFKSASFILLPPTEKTAASWGRPKDCIWHPPPINLSTKVALESQFAQHFANFEENRDRMASLFKNTFNVPSLTWNFVVDEIRASKTNRCFDVNRMKALYECLDNMNLIGLDLDNLRNTFNTEALLCSFADTDPYWHKSSECVWRSFTRTHGKAPLNNEQHYDGLEYFFLNSLSILEAIFEMTYEPIQRQELALSKNDANRVPMELDTLYPFTDADYNPCALFENQISPVKFAGGKVQLRGGGNGLDIIGCESLASGFDRNVKFLDLKAKELASVHLFLKWVGLEHKLRSQVVRKTFSPNKSALQIISRQNHGLRQKAPALSWYGYEYSEWTRCNANYVNSADVSHGSPRAKAGTQQSYSVLITSTNLEVDELASKLRLKHYERCITIENTKAFGCYIYESEINLEILVPLRTH